MTGVKGAGLGNGITNVITAGGVNVIHCCSGKQALTGGFSVSSIAQCQKKMEMLLKNGLFSCLGKQAAFKESHV